MEKVNDMKTKKKKIIPEFPIPIEDRFPIEKFTISANNESWEVGFSEGKGGGSDFWFASDDDGENGYTFHNKKECIDWVLKALNKDYGKGE
tara:strand:- start:733 stop:1005 length:273 start_codon:yes stop_codon:yes gene_type:complete